MKKEVRWIICIFSFLYFVDLAIALKVKDVQVVGPGNAEIGLATFNTWFRNLWTYNSQIGISPFWYLLSIVLCVMAGLFCLFWVGLGIYQYSKDKDSRDIDKSLIATYGLYILALVFFLIYRKFSINFGPVYMPGSERLAVSFPSFNGMIFTAGFGSTIYLSGYFLEDMNVNKKTILIIRIALAVLMVLGILASMLAGTEWITDILGGICFTIPLLVIYSFFCEV